MYGQQMTPVCPKCNGTGWRQYDHNHRAVCDACCKHDKGWWELTEQYYRYEIGKDNRCCKAGCGTMFRDLKTNEEQGNETTIHAGRF